MMFTPERRKTASPVSNLCRCRNSAAFRIKSFTAFQDAATAAARDHDSVTENPVVTFGARKPA